MKTNRSTSRLAAVQALYQQELTGEDADKILKDLLTGKIGREVILENAYTDKEEYVPVIAPDPDLLTGIVKTYMRRKDDVETLVKGCLKDDWTKEKTEILFWAILCAGVSELIAFPENPVSVVINEYVDITQSFYDSKSPEVRVANGIFHTVSETIREK